MQQLGEYCGGRNRFQVRVEWRLTSCPAESRSTSANVASTSLSDGSPGFSSVLSGLAQAFKNFLTAWIVSAARNEDASISSTLLEQLKWVEAAGFAATRFDADIFVVNGGSVGAFQLYVDSFQSGRLAASA